MATRIAFLFLITKEAYFAARFFINAPQKNPSTSARVFLITYIILCFEKLESIFNTNLNI